MVHDQVVKTVRLTVITDFVCVSCCIGQHELLDAIKHCQDTLNLPLQFEMEHIPFRLISPTLLPDDCQTKEDREAFLAKVLGKERFIALQSNVSKYAEEKDRPISLHGIMSPTTKAHRLVLKAGRLGGQKLQTPLISAVFAASMELGKDIADSEVLAEIAADCDVLTREETIAFLDSDELKKEVEEMSAAARAKGITGVPMIVIDGKWAVNGGQSSDVYVQIFKKLATCQGAKCAPIPSGLIDPAI